MARNKKGGSNNKVTVVNKETPTTEQKELDALLGNETKEEKVVTDESQKELENPEQSLDKVDADQETELNPDEVEQEFSEDEDSLVQTESEGTGDDLVSNEVPAPSSDATEENQDNDSVENPGDEEESVVNKDQDDNTDKSGVEDQDEAPADEEVTAPELEVPETCKHTHGILKAYDETMGTHRVPTREDMAHAQNSLYNLIINIPRMGVDVMERLSFVVEHFKRNESGAFKEGTLFRGIGDKKVIASRERSEEARALFAVFITLANDKRDNSRYIDLGYLSDALEPKTAQVVIPAIRTLAGLDKE